MKFKTIFALFNAILLFSFAFIFFMPFVLLGGGYSFAFWAKNWPLAALFLVIIAGFNAFFIANWKLFRLLEAEDWDALSSLLAERVYTKKRYGRRTIRLFVNTSLLRGDMAAIDRLESALRGACPKALRRDAVLFGAAYLLRNDPAASERFLKEFADGSGVENAPWIGYYYGFVLVMQRRAVEAVPLLQATLDSRDAVLSLLSAYLLGSLCAASSGTAERERLMAEAEARRAVLAGRYTPARWAREAERAKSEIHIVILSKVLDDAGAWLFPQAAS